MCHVIDLNLHICVSKLFKLLRISKLLFQFMIKIDPLIDDQYRNVQKSLYYHRRNKTAFYFQNFSYNCLYLVYFKTQWNGVVFRAFAWKAENSLDSLRPKTKVSVRELLINMTANYQKLIIKLHLYIHEQSWIKAFKNNSDLNDNSWAFVLESFEVAIFKLH